MVFYYSESILTFKKPIIKLQNSIFANMIWSISEQNYCLSPYQIFYINLLYLGPEHTPSQL